MFHQTSIRSVSVVAAVLFAAGITAERVVAQDSDGVVVIEVQTDPHKALPKPIGVTLKVPHVIGGDIKVSHIDFTVRAPVSNYQIGVACFPVEGALRAQLNLPKGQGLLVDLVLPDQPAAKAGVKKYDVILAVNGVKVGDLKDLIAAIDKAKEHVIELEVLRGGKQQTISVTPVKRLQVTVFGLVEGKLGKLPDDVIKKFNIEGFRFNVDPKFQKGDFHFQAVRPGVFFGGLKSKLPKNLSVTIVRSGEAPAKILVKQGDQKWEITEKELDKLPKDVRGHVERIVGRSRPDHFWIEGDTYIKLRSSPAKAVRVQPRVRRGEPVEKQLEQMRVEMREIRKALDELLKTRRKQAKSE